MSEEKSSIGLAAINVVVFAVMAFMGGIGNADFMIGHGAIYPPKMLTEGVWYPLFTAMFLHFDIEHLANNMIMLVAVGSYVEKNMGSVRVVILYLLAGLGGNVLSFVNDLHGHINTVSAGASGAVFGLVGALLALAIKNKGTIEKLGIKRIILMIALSLVSGLTTAGVDNVAHIGGLICGIILGFILGKNEEPEEPMPEIIDMQ